MEEYPEELQQAHPEKPDKNSNQEKNQQLNQEKGKLPKMKIGKIKEDTPDAYPHVIPEVEKAPESDIRVEITSTHKYNTI